MSEMSDDNLGLEALAAIPGGPGDDIPDDGFSARVIGGIARRRRRRAIMLGAAGTAGSAIAGAQFTAIANAMEIADLSQQAGLLGALTPESMATVAIAGLVAVVGMIVPGRI